MPLTPLELSRLSAPEVDQIFRRGEVGPIPDGDAEGTAILRPGSSTEPWLQRLIHGLAWQGKVVRADRHSLKNKVSPLGIRAISADVYPDKSWFDGEPCIVIDYSHRSLVARWVRDEIRRVAPGLYLGHAYFKRTRLLYFTLQFAPVSHAEA
jgi:hypothetical protein